MAYLHHKQLAPSVFPHSIAFNNIPQIGSINDEGITSEEVKIISETKKILNLPNLPVSAFAVRTPTMNGHSEAIWVTLNEECTRTEFVDALKKAPGIQVIDEPSRNQYPMNATASGTDPVYIGRIHADPAFPKSWVMWCVSDNVRKGAALNGVQIFEKIFEIETN
jgi:aspartate-semialdehyde dehydrogenase